MMFAAREISRKVRLGMHQQFFRGGWNLYVSNVFVIYRLAESPPSSPVTIVMPRTFIR